MSPASRRPRAPRVYLYPPPTPRSGRSSRRSSVSMSTTGTQHTNMMDPSIAVPPTSQTGDSIHHSALGDSVYLDTTHAPTSPDPEADYIWETTMVPEVGSANDPVNDQHLFPPFHWDAGTPGSSTAQAYAANPHLDLPSNDVDAFFRFVIRTLQRNYTVSRQPAQFAWDLAVTTLGPQAIEDYRQAIQQPAPESPTPQRSGYKCKMCDSPQIFKASSFKRHVGEQHRAKSYFHCLMPLCSYRHCRKHRTDEHMMKSHARQSTEHELMRSEIFEPIPTFCDICNDEGLQEHIGPFASWDAWYKGIESHCLILVPEPATPANDPFFPGFDGGGGGAGGYGGPTGHGSAPHGQQGTSPGGLFPLSTGPLDLGSAWSNLSPYGLAVARRAALVDTLANRPIPPTNKPSARGPIDSRSKQHIRQLFHDAKTRRRAPPVGQTPSYKPRCNRCKHVYGSCLGCPPTPTQESCHVCGGQHARALVLIEQATSRVDAGYKRFADTPTSMLGVPTSGSMPYLLFSMTQLSLVSPSISRLTGTVSRDSFRLKTVGGPNQTCVDGYQEKSVNALMTKHKMLRDTSESSPAWGEKVLTEITHCHTALDALKNEVATSSSVAAEQRARQKRLASLYSQLRAVTFVLSLSKEAISTNNQKEESKNNLDNSQMTLFRSLGSKVPPLTFLDLGSLFYHVCEHFHEDFWPTSSLFDVSDEDGRKADTDNPIIFLRVCMTAFRGNFCLKGYVPSKFFPIIETLLPGLST